LRGYVEWHEENRSCVELAEENGGADPSRERRQQSIDEEKEKHKNRNGTLKKKAGSVPSGEHCLASGILSNSPGRKRKSAEGGNLFGRRHLESSYPESK